jgi:hypothetical protein
MEYRNALVSIRRAQIGLSVMRSVARSRAWIKVLVNGPARGRPHSNSPPDRVITPWRAGADASFFRCAGPPCQPGPAWTLAARGAPAWVRGPTESHAIPISWRKTASWGSRAFRRKRPPSQAWPASVLTATTVIGGTGAVPWRRAHLRLGCLPAFGGDTQGRRRRQFRLGLQVTEPPQKIISRAIATDRLCTGVVTTPDGKTMLVDVQHPGGHASAERCAVRDLGACWTRPGRRAMVLP